MSIPVGLQLYTVRDETEKDFIGTLEKVAEIGYQGVEFAGFGDISSSQMKETLNQLGLKSIGNHTGLDLLQNNLEEVFAYNREIGSDYIICPWAEYDGKHDFMNKAKLYNKIGQKCKTAGFEFAYHNHAHEFEQFAGKYGLDIIYEETDSDFVKAELDTCFIKIAGLDPVDYMKKYAGRVLLLHLKDLEPGEKRGTVEIGNGILDIEDIVETAEKIGVKWIIVEQEFFAKSSLESTRTSFENLKQMGLV